MSERIGIDGFLRCADCSALIDPKRDHTCREQVRRNKRAARKTDEDLRIERRMREEGIGPEDLAEAQRSMRENQHLD